MRHYLYALILLILLVLAVKVRAQEIWTASSSGQYLKKSINLDGNILLLKTDGLQCLSKANGKEMWSAKIEKAKSIERISGTALLYVITETGGVILNSLDGKVACNSVTAGHTKFDVIKAQSAIIWGSTSNATEVLVLNGTTGAVLSKTKVADKAATFLEAHKQSGDGVIIFSSFGATALNLTTGEIFFNVPLKTSQKVVELYEYYKPTFNVFAQKGSDNIRFIKSGFLYNLNAKTGEVLGEKDLNAAIVVSELLNDDQVIIGNQDKKELTLVVYNLKTCQEERRSAVRASNVHSLLKNNNDLFALSTSTLGGSSVKLIDLATLTLKADKTFKTGGAYFGDLFMSAKGIGLTGGYGLNYYDPSTYQSTLQTKYYVPSDKAQVTGDSATYFFYNGYLGSINKAKGEEKLLYSEKLPVKLMEEEKPQLQLAEDGVLILGSQSVAKVNFKGELVYNQYFAPPGASAGSIITNALVLAASSYLAVDAQEKLNATSTNKQYWAAERDAFTSIGGEAGKNIRERYSKTSNSQNYQIILTQTEKGETGNFKLVKFNKSTGKVEGQIVVDSRTPDYVFDPIESTVYLFSSEKVSAQKI